MSEESKRRQAEELLEKALSAFGECEPPGDLEERILRQVRGARSKRSFPWLAALAAAAALLIGLILIDHWRVVPPPETTVAELPAPRPRPEPEPQSQPGRADSQVPTPPTPPRRATAPKAPVVQAPAPVVESEISPLPQSELAFSSIVSSPIQIQDLDQETTPLISELGGSGSEAGPVPEQLISGL